MKWLILSIILVFGLFFLVQNVFAENTYLDNYSNSHLVLAGKVLSLEQRHNATIYEVQVEKYYKNPQSAKVIAVFGPAKGIYYMHDPTFEVSDRLFLYLEKRDGIWLIQNPSFKLQYNCDVSVLVPSTFDTYLHGMPASDDSPKFSDADFIGDIHKVGKKMQVKYIIYNYTPFIKHATVTLLINGTNQNKTVFSDQKTVVVPACNGSVPLEWNYTPQRADDYVAQAQVTAAYDVPYSLMIMNEPYVANSFQVRENVAGGSIDRTVYPIIPSPLQQFKSGIPIEKIQCSENLMLVKKKDGYPACIKASSLSTLSFRNGFDCVWNCNIPIPVDGIKPDNTMIVDGKPFYYYIVNETLNSAQGEGKKIIFHDVTFTLFPRPFFMNLGGYCGSGSLGTSILFSDGTRESLKINIPQSECTDKFTKDDLTKLTNHTNPQAGLTFYNGKARLLASYDSSEYQNKDLIESNSDAAIELDKKTYTWTDKIRITITDHDHNQDTNTVDEIGNTDDSLRIYTQNGALANYHLVETGVDTGIFMGTVTLVGFDHDTNGAHSGGIPRFSMSGNGTGPTDGYIKSDRKDTLTILYEPIAGKSIIKSAPIQWNAGRILWLNTSYPSSGTGTVRVIDPDMNLDPDAIDEFDIKISAKPDSTDKNDWKDVVVRESDKASGVFDGTVFFSTLGDTPGNRLEVSSGDQVIAKYLDNTLPNPFSANDEIEITNSTSIR